MGDFWTSIEDELDNLDASHRGGPRFAGDYNADATIVKQVQTAINGLGYTPALAVDGAYGPNTEAGIKWLQGQKGLTVDGIIGPATLGALGIAVPGAATTSAASTVATGAKGVIASIASALGIGSTPSAASTSSTASSGTIANVRGIDKLTPDDLTALVAAAQWIGINPDWLASVMSFESGFSPSIHNAAGSGAVGLIQFMPSTAQGLGTTTAALEQMTFVQQLEYVKKYFAPYQGKLNSLEDTYLAVFYPAFIGKANDAVLGSTGSAIYDQNAGFDSAHKGYVTKEDITTTIRGVLNGAVGRIPIPGMIASPVAIMSDIAAHPVRTAAIVGGGAVGLGLLLWGLTRGGGV